MARQSKTRKVKRKIKFTKRARLVHKNDATRVVVSNSPKFKRIEGRSPSDVAPTFKIKIKRKNE